MNSSVRIDKQFAFQVGETEVRKLWQRLQDCVGQVSAHIHCSDSMVRVFDTADVLLSYENPNSSAIVGLTLKAVATDHSIEATVRFSSTRFEPPISADVSGQEAEVVVLKNSLCDIFSGMKQWYTPIVRVDFFYAMLLLVMFALLVISAMHGSTPETKSLGFGTAIVAASVLFVPVVVASLFGWILNRLWKRVFPIATFAIGQGKSRSELDDKIRWVVLVGFIVSCFASLVLP